MELAFRCLPLGARKVELAFGACPPLASHARYVMPPAQRWPTLAFLPGAAPGTLFDAAVARLRAMALAVNFYVRPSASSQRRGARGGSALVQPPADRLVPVEDDTGLHIAAALRLPFPQPEFDAPWAADLVAAVGRCVEAGDGLPGWRRDRLAEARDIAASLALTSTRASSRSPPAPSATSSSA